MKFDTSTYTIVPPTYWQEKIAELEKRNAELEAALAMTPQNNAPSEVMTAETGDTIIFNHGFPDQYSMFVDCVDTGLNENGTLTVWPNVIMGSAEFDPSTDTVIKKGQLLSARQTPDLDLDGVLEVLIDCKTVHEQNRTDDSSLYKAICHYIAELTQHGAAR